MTQNSLLSVGDINSVSQMNIRNEVDKGTCAYNTVRGGENEAPVSRYHDVQFDLEIKCTDSTPMMFKSSRCPSGSFTVVTRVSAKIVAVEGGGKESKKLQSSTCEISLGTSDRTKSSVL